MHILGQYYIPRDKFSSILRVYMKKKFNFVAVYNRSLNISFLRNVIERYIFFQYAVRIRAWAGVITRVCGAGNAGPAADYRHVPPKAATLAAPGPLRNRLRTSRIRPQRQRRSRRHRHPCPVVLTTPSRRQPSRPIIVHSWRTPRRIIIRSSRPRPAQRSVRTLYLLYTLWPLFFYKPYWDFNWPTGESIRFSFRCQRETAVIVSFNN